MLTKACTTALFAQLSEALAMPLGTPPLHPVSGGDISMALTAATPAGPVFIKYQADASALEMFACEVDGLEALRATATCIVPDVLWHGGLPQGAALVLKQLALSARGEEAALGRALAALHQRRHDRFGWWRDNYLGRSPQYNGWLDDWAEFFWQRRLRPQLAAAAATGLSFTAARLDDLERRTHQLLDHAPPPVLVHGDLWRGNVGWVSGRPALYDPAVYYGDGEVDLAMAQLFGGFGDAFFAAYHELRPALPGAPLRTRLYNLYHLLNHYNLFGGSYADQCRARVDELLRAR